MSDLNYYVIVDKVSGNRIWSTKFATTKSAKLSIQNNNFILSNVGIALLDDEGNVSGNIIAFNYKTKIWEELS